MNLILNDWMMTLMISDHPVALLAQAGARTATRTATKSPNLLLTMLFTLVVTAIAFYLISFLPIVEIDSPVTALVCAFVFGALNVVSQPIENALNFTLLLSPVAFILNALMFWITDLLIGGFKIKNGIIGILLGSVALTFVQAIVRKAIEVIF